MNCIPCLFVLGVLLGDEAEVGGDDGTWGGHCFWRRERDAGVAGWRISSSLSYSDEDCDASDSEEEDDVE